MNQKPTNPNQLSLLLRLVAGGYLLYTAWDLRGAFQEGPLYIISAVAFAVVGLLLAGISLYQIAKTGDFFIKETPTQEEDEAEKNEDCEDASDE